MQTQFKWNAKQRMLIIESMAMAISRSDEIKYANQMGQDIGFFSGETAEFLNTSEYIQTKLKFVFELAKQLGTTEMHDKLVSLETSDDEVSFAG